jgi:hypothetical protein
MRMRHIEKMKGTHACNRGVDEPHSFTNMQLEYLLRYVTILNSLPEKVGPIEVKQYIKTTISRR